jgi:hypothetical protein
MEEVWINLKGEYEKYVNYEISNLCKIRNKKTKKELTPTKRSEKDSQVTLYCKGEKIAIGINKLYNYIFDIKGHKPIKNNQVKLNGNTFIEKENFYIGICKDGTEFYFDKEDYNRIKNHTWHKVSTGYIVSVINNKNIRLHRFILNVVDLKNEKVDHINRNPLDNRKKNLRLVDNSKNSLNRKTPSMFGLKCIYWTGVNKKWNVYIQRNNIVVSDIYFENVIDAINYKIKWGKENDGEYRYAWENDININEILDIEVKLKSGEIKIQKKDKKRVFMRNEIGFHSSKNMWSIYVNKKAKRFTYLEDAIDYKIKNSLNYEDACIWKEELNIYEKELKEVI